MNDNKQTIDEEGIYDQIFDFYFLIENGYYDILPVKNSSYIEEDYSTTEGINTSIFNYKELRKFIEDNPSFENMIEESVDNDKESIPTTPISFTIPKNYVSNKRREYKMPNIFSYIKLAKYISNHKKDIVNCLKKDKHSVSKFFNQKNFVSYNDITFLKQKLLQGGGIYYLELDMADFYHTIYTHSIPWMLEGYVESKQNKNKKQSLSFANQLDKLIQNSQCQETYGLPTGNLITRIIAELYMTHFDEKLNEQYEFKFWRYVDDFTFTFFNSQEENDILRTINSLCKTYKLRLNESKTKLVRFPYVKQYDKTKIFEFFDNVNPQKTNYHIKIYEFINLCIDEESKGNKGSIKCMFNVLSYQLKFQEFRCAILETMKSYNPLQHILDISLKFSQLSNRFIEFIENLIDQNGMKKQVKDLMKDYFDEYNIQKNLSFYKEQHFDQEIYQILLYLVYFDIDIDINKYKITEFISDEFDDFINILAIILLLKSDKDDLAICLILNDFLDRLKEKNIYGTTGSNKDEFIMREHHWFVRYFIFYIVKEGILDVNSFYKEKRVSTGDNGYESPFNYKYILRQTNNKKSINNFFKQLLDENVSFVEVGQTDNRFKYI